MERGNTSSYREEYDYEDEDDTSILQIDGGCRFDRVEEEMAKMNCDNNNNNHNNNIYNNEISSSSSNRTSELTIAFEGEVYVFPAVTPHKVQAVLLLLGGADTPAASVPSSEFLVQQNAGVYHSLGDSDTSRESKLSRRIASLVRFREKRKERCFEKKIRYTCRKEVAQRMHRKNGQFASLKDCYSTGTGSNWEPSNTTPQSEPICQHCGTSENATPAMRRGPAGPRTLCNACGLMWANKGTLRDLTKGGRHVSFDQNELGTPDFKPSTMEQENPYVNQDEEGSPEESKPVLLDSENSMRPNDQDLLETDDTVTDPLPTHVENSSVNLDDEDFQETLDGLGNVSGSEFEIPGNFDDQVDIGDCNMGSEWSGT
ncbi:GATA transcription factor 19 isoform X2 [Ricinus communis]|uniref:GATA transcription factor 19 isoform X2 n=1 Tax=Ricinus communis TaxID=3988 RepID=UPI00201A53F7|nr:GATA transcription factor 19 isoform X2 [Ricinus communis]